MSDSAGGASAHHDHHHEPFWRKYIFSIDHKVIGIQYGLTALVFLLFGFFLMLIMRWQLANPGSPVPFLGTLMGHDKSIWFSPDGVLVDNAYNMFGAMHGTIMVFLGVVPLGVGAFGLDRVFHAPMATYRLALPSRAFLVGGLIADSKDKIHGRCFRRRKLGQSLRPQGRDIVPLVAQNLHRKGIEL